MPLSMLDLQKGGKMIDRIGIIVPVYNVEKYIRKCVDSIIEQSYKNWKMILIDDGSPDNCPDICDEYRKKDDRIEVIHKANGGLVSAWKAGIEALSYRENYIVFVDSDDWLTRDYLKHLAEHHNSNNADIVVTQLKIVYSNGLSFQRPYGAKTGFYNKAHIISDIYPKLINTGEFQKRIISTVRYGKLIKADLIKQNKKYINTSTTYEEDFNIMVPVMLDANSIDIVDDANCIYMNRVNPSSMTHAYDKKMLQSIEWVYPSVERALKDRSLFDFFEEQLLADYLAASVQYYKNELLFSGTIKCIVGRIRSFCKNNQRLSRAIELVNWNKYRKLNMLIIYSMKYCNQPWSYIIIFILRILKQYNYKKLLKQEIAK